MAAGFVYRRLHGRPWRAAICLLGTAISFYFGCYSTGSKQWRKRFMTDAAPSRSYPDLHDHITALDQAGLLVRVARPINKDKEMHPLVRWQFRGGFLEKDRKAFLFTNVIDSKGKRYDIDVVVGALAANREIYRIGL